jgi:hypothetical protein
VTALIRMGRTDAEIMEAIKMPEYSSWGSYNEWQQLNVRGMITYVKEHYRF